MILKTIYLNALIISTCILLVGCLSQNAKNQPAPESKIVGGGCDGCELMYVGMPKQVTTIDTSAGWNEPGQKLIISGTVFKNGGRKPAPGVIIYYWQTDHKGYYSPGVGMEELAKAHGHIRGWVKSDENGKYTFYTNRPAPYPRQNLPAHIHLSIKEPDLNNEYYVDDLNFDDDELLYSYLRKHPQENRGGSGIVRVLLNDSIQIGWHDIILGLNIPNYPGIIDPVIQSGLPIGVDHPSFMPYHAYGPDKGTQVCPVCKYGRFLGILYYVGNHPQWDEIKSWLAFLEQLSAAHGKYLKVFFIYGNELGYDKEKRMTQLAQMGEELNIKNIALTFVPSFTDKELQVNLTKVNPEVGNTFILFKQSRIVDKYIELKPTKENFHLINNALTNWQDSSLSLTALSRE